MYFKTDLEKRINLTNKLSDEVKRKYFQNEKL